ncbi:hypothetical protein BDA96_08G068300 [Sorghum bicolor]|uniref:Bifunctional inhibitor/plant lipid transfer protein/seed storage helical domain-containing protein n=1 Tax=Sorghum bicolor TaxID=4558 RepID=A0A921QGF0_SORBI|nr:hypothetical protein BDA96_08G068300 [Sorghum bicolor]
MAKLLLGLLLVLVIIGTTSADNCAKDAEAMKQECKKFEVFPANPKLKPSPACCAVWQRADIPCLCKRVTPEIEKVWCMEKVVYVANYCKKPFTPGYKCGSYTVPKSL